MSEWIQCQFFAMSNIMVMTTTPELFIEIAFQREIAGCNVILELFPDWFAKSRLYEVLHARRWLIRNKLPWLNFLTEHKRCT
jgi:hypothetical protein